MWRSFEDDQARRAGDTFYGNAALRPAPNPMPLTQAEHIALVIPTLNAGRHLDRLVPALASQTLRPGRFLVVDSGSSDGTPEVLAQAGATVRAIAQETFDHGGTRQMAVEMLPEAEVVIFLTQDAVPADRESLANLIRPFAEPTVGVTYGRQLPQPGAGPLASHARLFNYPEQSHVRSLADVPRFGVKTAFCSNSFAAYRRRALLDVGGFPAPSVHGEDMLAVAALLKGGWTVHYVADARVYHSHDYTAAQTFRRYFDIGVLHATSWDRLVQFGTPEGEGWRFLRSEMAYLAERKPGLIPDAMWHTLCKYAAYRLGLLQSWLPLQIKRKLGMNSGYWG